MLPLSFLSTSRIICGYHAHAIPFSLGAPRVQAYASYRIAVTCHETSLPALPPATLKRLPKIL